MKVDDVPQLASADKRLDLYRKRRTGMIDTADNQRELARWCRKNKLSEQAQLHWLRVLGFNPHDTEALHTLKLEYYNGQLLTPAQIQESRKQAGVCAANLREWQPRLSKWCDEVNQGAEQDQAQATRALRELDDREALPALIALANSPKLQASTAGPLLLEAIHRNSGAGAVRALVAIAIDGSNEKVRDQAAGLLARSLAIAVVPHLLAQQQELNPIEVETSFHVMRIGPHVVRGHYVVLRDNYRTRTIDLSSYFTFNSRDGVPAPITQMLHYEIEGARQIEREALDVRRNNETHLGAVQARNERLASVVAKLSEVQLGNDPTQWQQRWNDYTETYAPSYSPPSVNQTEYYQFFSHCHFQLSCFPAGTPVTTVFGQQPIESIRPGDLVLAQDVATGELAFKCVHDTTLRPAAPLLKLRSGSQEVLATRGHPFWVNGRGWQMAKFLKAGDWLHGLSGPVSVESVADAPAVEAYNLIVDGFNTFFVGETGLLVHDNLPLSDVAPPAVPGLAAAAH